MATHWLLALHLPGSALALTLSDRGALRIGIDVDITTAEGLLGSHGAGVVGLLSLAKTRQPTAKIDTILKIVWV